MYLREKRLAANRAIGPHHDHLMHCRSEFAYARHAALQSVCCSTAGERVESAMDTIPQGFTKKYGPERANAQARLIRLFPLKNDRPQWSADAHRIAPLTHESQERVSIESCQPLRSVPRKDDLQCPPISPWQPCPML